MKYTFGLCAGRHDCPVDAYIYKDPITGINSDELVSQANKAIPEDCHFLVVYVTGFTPAMLAVAQLCFTRRISLLTMNYDRDSGNYVRIPVMLWTDRTERVPGI